VPTLNTSRDALVGCIEVEQAKLTKVSVYQVLFVIFIHKWWIIMYLML